MDTNGSITKQDLMNMEDRLLNSFMTFVRQQDLQLEERLKAFVREQDEKFETKLLTAFHGWARTMEVRVRGTTTLVVGMEERMALLEERVSHLESKH